MACYVLRKSRTDVAKKGVKYAPPDKAQKRRLAHPALAPHGIADIVAVEPPGRCDENAVFAAIGYLICKSRPLACIHEFEKRG